MSLQALGAMNSKAGAGDPKLIEEIIQNVAVDRKMCESHATNQDAQSVQNTIETVPKS